MFKTSSPAQAVFISCLYLLFLASCADPPVRTGITLFTWVPAEEQSLNQKLLDRFHNLHKDIRVEFLNHASSRAMDKLQTMMASGEAPDVISIHGAFFPAFAAKGALLDLEPFVSGTDGIDTNDIYPGLRSSSRFGGKLYSLPRYLSVYVLFYNKDLFEAEGVPLPGKDWSWDDFLNAARMITKDTDGDGKTDRWGCAVDFWGTRVYPWIWQNGEDIFTPDLRTCVIDRPAAIEAINFLSDLQFKHKVTPRVVPDEYRNNMEMFRTGKVAMIIGGAWDIQTLKSSQFRWEIAPLPGRKRKATMIGSENYAISSGTGSPEKAWKLLKFLLSSESQRFMAEKLDKQPSLRSVGAEYAACPAAYDRKVLVEAVDYGVLPPNPSRWPEISHYLQDRLDLVWVGKLSVKQAMQEACRDINLAMR